MYITTDIFKSNSTLFFKYLGKNSENINEVIYALGNNIDNLESKKYEENSEFQINYIENYETNVENKDNAINKLRIKLEGKTDEENNYQYKNIKLLNEDETAAQIEYIKKDKEYGIKFSDLFSQYLVVENNNLKELLKKMGYSDEEVQDIPDSLEIKDFKDIKFSDEELEILKQKYFNLISSKIPKDKFSKKSNQTISINENTIKANEYTLTLTKEQLNNIYIDILQTIKEDEIILGKLDEFQKNYNINLGKNTKNDVKTMYESKIEETIDKINKTNIGTDETKIIVYESKGNTVSTILQTTNKEIDFDNLNTNEERYSAIIIKDYDKETKKMTFKEKDNNIEIIIEDKSDENPIKITYTKNQYLNDKEYNENIEIIYEDGNNKIQSNYKNILKEANLQEGLTEFTDENSVKLNDLNSEQLSAVLARVNEGIERKTTEIMQQTKIEEEIQKILKNIGIKKDIEILESERSI